MSRVMTPEPREQTAPERTDQALTSRVIAGIAIGLIVLVGIMLSVVAYGYVWYRTSGFIEQNQQSFKPQEVAYPAAVSGTIPVTGRETVVNTRAQAKLLINEIPATADSLRMGEDLYITYCQPCHGLTGNGKGIMGSVPALGLISNKESKDLADYLEGFMSFRPDIDINFVQHETEGELFYSITNGGESIMPSFKDALDVEQRWHIVNYIKKVLGGNDER